MEKNIPRQLSRKSALAFSSNLLIAIFGFVSMFFVKRYMGYEAVGMIAFATSFIAIFNIIGDLGIGMSHVKRVSEGMDFGRCNGTILTIKLFLTAAMVGSALAWILIQKYFLGYEFESREFEIIVYLILINAAILNIGTIFRSVFSARLEIAKGTIPRVIGRFVVMALKISVALLGFTVAYLACAEVFGGLLILILFIILFRGYPVKKPNRKYFKRYASFAIPMVFLGITAMLFENMDKIMIGFFIDSRHVGIYYIPQKIVTTVILVSIVVTNLLFPTFSEMYSKNQLRKIQDLASRAERYISMLLLPSVVFLAIFAEPVMVLVFGSDAIESVPVLRVMIIGVFISALMYPYLIQISATGHLKLLIKISILAVGLNILLNVVLIPSELHGISLFGLGVTGAALATVVSFSTEGILGKYFAYKITGAKSKKRILIHFFSAIVTGSTVYYLYSTISFSWYHMFIYFLLTIGIFFGILIIFKEFTRKDLEFYLRAIHPGKMKEYIEDEMRIRKR